MVPFPILRGKMIILTAMAGGDKIAFSQEPQYPIFCAGDADLEFQILTGSFINEWVCRRTHNGSNVYFKADPATVGEGISGFLIRITVGSIMCMFVEADILKYIKNDVVYAARKGSQSFREVRESDPIQSNYKWVCSISEFRFEPEGTNICTKCGYENEYMDPVVDYVCTQCRMRNDAWR